MLFVSFNSPKKYEGKVESSSVAYNRRETRYKRPLGWDPDRSWCHLHTSVKLLLVPAHDSMNIGGSILVSNAAAQSEDPWDATKKALR